MVPARARAILDLGCSNGALGSALRAQTPGRTVMGVEIDRTLASEASARLDRVACLDLGSDELDQVLAGHSFDCIVFGDVLEHLPSPWTVLAKAAKYLAPTGAMIVSLPNVRHVSALWAIAVSGTFPRRERGIFDQTHLRWFTYRDARALLEEQGFVVDKVSCNLRFGDRGGGAMNRLLNRYGDALDKLAPVREFLTYQFCIRARRQPFDAGSAQADMPNDP
ncbi:MAG: methyltransferase domain-containing protein [Burkholderiaceae bacterium]|nr:methyltransferase domain-containing protein [Burkholderiaceae bacterium]